MPLSLYQTSVPAFTRGLDNLSALLEKARAHAQANGIDPSSYANARLAPDMFPLMRQIQIASDTVKGAAARLAGMPPPSFPDTETTFDELQERIAKTLAFIATVSEAQINAREDGSITLKLGSKEATFSSKSYLLEFVLPNFYFHLTAAYAILRHQGVPLGKMDYLGNF